MPVPGSLSELLPNFVLSLPEQEQSLIKNFLKDIEIFILISNKYFVFKAQEEKARVSFKSVFIFLGKTTQEGPKPIEAGWAAGLHGRGGARDRWINAGYATGSPATPREHLLEADVRTAAESVRSTPRRQAIQRGDWMAEL